VDIKQKVFMTRSKIPEKAGSRVVELSNRLIGLDEASSLLKISKGTLCNWLSSGRHGLQRVKVSGRTHVDRLQIEALLEKSLGADVD
jgi:hypothetical protein